MSKSRNRNRISRRKFLEGTGAAIVAAAEAPVLRARPGDTPAAPGTTIRVKVNGETHRVSVQDHWTLVELLRDHLKLTGTKIGCDRGECGACTVLLDGKPVYSCSQLAVWSNGRSVETVDGLARNGELNALQKAFVEHDAPQCGFCTSGQIMSATALLARNPRPSIEDARAALTGNICRCSNYNRYVEATLAAAGVAVPASVTADETRVAALRTVGHATARIDAPERVSGKAVYTRDVDLPGMLYGAVLRSPHPHARIRRIDISGAAAIPGVKAVLTHENCEVVWGAGGVAGGVQYNDQVK
ncbi:MAG TPA: 2Fe-2S iron-sulfur cluster-binding protein, partial [Bryobacteraceae bacterium]|nr:2Fe-2S iron-sulfur cluster-binding protein [Bryobacteraceae bacterium]